MQSGGGAVVRAAAFTVADAQRGGVTFTMQVPDGFHAPLTGGGMSATLLLTPDEARGFAAWLDQAAASADEVGPPLYPRAPWPFRAEPPRFMLRLMAVKALFVSLLAATTLMTGCSGGCNDGAGFSNSMASSGGHVTPQAALDAAATEDAANYPFDVPTGSWELGRDTSAQQTFRSGDVEMTVLRLPDATWAVESGRCVSG